MLKLPKNAIFAVFDDIWRQSNLPGGFLGGLSDVYFMIQEEYLNLWGQVKTRYYVTSLTSHSGKPKPSFLPISSGANPFSKYITKIAIEERKIFKK